MQMDLTPVSRDFWRAKQIAHRLGIGLSTWWMWVATGRAPKGIKIGEKTTVWRAADIDDLVRRLSAA